MDLNATLAGTLTKAAKRWLGPFRRHIRELERSQWWDEHRIREYQIHRLRLTAVKAYRDVPFYRRWFDACGFDPEKLRDLTDLSVLPVLNKADVMAAGSSLYSRRIPRIFTRQAHTGGTTGTPQEIRRDLWSIGHEHAFLRRQWRWAGINNVDRCAYLTGRLIVPADETSERLYRYDPVMRELILSTYHLSERVAAQYIKAMRDAKVVALVAYPSAAYVLAKACIDQDQKIGLRAVLTSSETLHPEIRSLITKAFKCPVFDFYGSAERVCYIHTCERGTYHVIPEYGYTELVPTDAAGNAKVVSTGFWNTAMPFIRYELGDIVCVRPTTCSCGRAFPAVSAIIGRPSEYLTTPSGRQLGAALLTHILYGARNFVESQIVQDAVDHCIIKYVPADNFSATDLEDFRRIVDLHMPRELQIEYEAVDAIARTSSGKLRPIVNLCTNAGSKVGLRT